MAKKTTKKTKTPKTPKTEKPATTETVDEPVKGSTILMRNNGL